MEICNKIIIAADTGTVVAPHIAVVLWRPRFIDGALVLWGSSEAKSNVARTEAQFTNKWLLEPIDFIPLYQSRYIDNWMIMSAVECGKIEVK